MGDIINQTTQFDITGRLISRVEVVEEEIVCSARKSRRTLAIHVPFLTFESARMACDKYRVGSMVGPFKVDWNTGVSRYVDTGHRGSVGSGVR